MKRFVFFIICGVGTVLAVQDVPSPLSRVSPKPSRPESKPAAAEPEYRFVETPAHQVEGVRKGLEWLSKNQNKDGSYGTRYPVAVTSLAGLAMMAGGSHPTQGPYKDQIAAALQYLISRQTRSGMIAEPNGKMMHSHGYAALFMAELYGMQIGRACRGGNGELRYRLKKAVRIIERYQSAQGGWYYYFDPESDEGSVTVTMLQALRSARNAGIQVDEQAIKKAFEYIRKSSNEDGSIAYAMTERSSSYALTAAGVSVLNFLGEYKGKEVDRGLEYLVKSLEQDPNETGRGNFPYYEDFYATLSFYHAGGKLWEMYYPRIRDGLMKSQKEDGSWDSTYGAEYGTAFAVLVLQVPYRYLPIMQR